MTIAGFQPMSLVDYPGVICSIIFTQGCPFRCGYCHNPDLIPHRTESVVAENEVLDYLDEHKKMLEGVCITGGEPTIHPDLPALIRQIKRRDYLVKLDTNGVNPQMVQELLNEKLIDFLAMDIKHVWNRYPDVIGTNNPAAIANCQKTFRLIQDSGLPHEFRTTVCSALHSAIDLVNIAKELHPGETFALQQVRYEKMLNPNFAKTPKHDLKKLAEKIQENQPTLNLVIRDE